MTTHGKKTAAAIVLSSLAVGATGCSSQAESPDDVVEAEQPVLTANALTMNSLTSNSLTGNSLTGNSLTQNSLTSNSLTGNSLVYDALHEGNSRTVLKYIAQCALPSTQTLIVNVDGTLYAFPGELNIAPSWGLDGGSCDTTCQEKVSSCVLAKLNYLGQVVQISAVQPSLGLTRGTAEAQSHCFSEGAFYGNIFASPMQKYACTESSVLQRTCGSSLSTCNLGNIVSCSSVCTGSPGAYTSCTANGVTYKYPLSTYVTGNCTNAADKSNVLPSGQQLNQDQDFFSPNGHWQVYMQNDGNVCLFNYLNGPTTSGLAWCSYSTGHGLNRGYYLKMQTDGNLCVYDPMTNTSAGFWCTGSNRGTGTSSLVLQNDGNLLVDNSVLGQVWSRYQ